MARRIPPRACMGFPDISKKTVIGAFQENTTTRDFLENLDDDKWDVTAWDPENRLVCFDATNDIGQILHYSLNIPNV